MPSSPKDLRFKSELTPQFGPADSQLDEVGYNEKIQRLELAELTTRYGVRKALICFLVVCCTVVLGTFTLNLILPTSLRWLNPGQLSDIKDVALTVAGGLSLSLGTTLFLKKP